MKEVERFYLVLHPRPAYIIGSGRVGEKANFMAASWVTPVAEEPPLVGVAIDVESLTHELIERYGEFTVNVVPTSMLDKLYYAGSRSGRDEDKASSIPHRKGEKVSAPVVEGAVGVVECVVHGKLRAEDVTFFAGRVVYAAVDERFFNERSGWLFKEIDLPLHNWGRGFYGVGRFYKA
ncbi:flavin reductase family protein [Thermofilum pendens]|uniref:Flavin reductase domain protein, FMN-binding n=1 Tax=Thermofilum pendens (strain DSM 2475 / Hrk 5) TaxID=368408 RepID=A1RZJ8_THEPD|nr:flavin reductase family protein [Thermofilum pendens]ABL78628.1 flavin reductase domain protein, FMN-binding [Thermofilum pendens Hrk 5]